MIQRVFYCPLFAQHKKAGSKAGFFAGAQEPRRIGQARAAHPVIDKMVTMREELRQLWLNTSQSREQLAADLAAWCHRAEASGIAGLREFSTRLRAARA